MKHIAFQGTHGAYSEQAILKYFAEPLTTLPCETFADIFLALNHGKADFGLLPVENVLGGTVLAAYDELLAFHEAVIIHAEVVLPIHHCLLGIQDSQLSDIVQALSHPQALDQCKNNLKALQIKPSSFYDTAGAAKYLAEHPTPTTAAIASSLAAHHYGLKVLKSNLEDQPFNRTRFFVLSSKGAPPHPLPLNADIIRKTSLLLILQNRPGSLANVLAIFAQAQLNLTKIESRPSRQGIWEYVFLLDFIGDPQQANYQKTLTAVKSQATSLILLGSYPVIEF